MMTIEQAIAAATAAGWTIQYDEDADVLRASAPYHTFGEWMPMADLPDAAVYQWRFAGKADVQPGLYLNDPTEPATGETEARIATAIDMRQLAADLLERIEDDLHVHVYSDDDVIPADSEHVALIDRARKALGMEPAGIETVPVWAYSATFCDTNGDPASYSTEVYCHTAGEALTRGRVDLDTVHRGATKVDARAVLTAGTVEG